jgi:hypothetical protein
MSGHPFEPGRGGGQAAGAASARGLLSTLRVSRLAALAVLLAPPAALAQTQNISVTTPATGTTAVTLGLDDCNNNRQVVFQWNLNVTPTASDSVRIFITKDTASCNASSEPTTAPSPPLIQPTTVNQMDQSTVTAKQLLLDLPNGCANNEHKASNPYVVVFCVRRTTAGVFTGFGNLLVNFALVPPNAPSQPSVTPGDSHLQLNWTSNDSGDQSYDVYVFPTGTPVDLTRPARNVSVPSVDVQRDSFSNLLQNGKKYDLFVRSIDAYGNHSGLSSPVANGTPVQVDDFYTHYRKEGGSAEGGCATGGSAGLLAAAALAAALWRRRRGTLLALTLLAAAPAARADWTGIDRRPRRWLVGFKIDRYDPQIDSESGLTGTPYHDIFHGRAPPRYQLEVDYQPLHPFGAVLFGFTVGFWQNHGKGLLSSSGQPSQDTAQLRIVPFGAVATYRLDWFADQYRWLPVVPYAQAGLQAALWTSLNATGSVSNPPSGGHGSGWSYGYTTALGIAIDVGAIDVALAREAYNETGIQRTSFFAEYGWTRLNDFGKSGALILSDRAWRFGLSVEF